MVRKLHKQGDMSVREIASALGLSTQTVYWHLSKNGEGKRGGKAGAGPGATARKVRRSK